MANANVDGAKVRGFDIRSLSKNDNNQVGC